ncbi:MAG: hypothetical protein Q8Q01_02625 [archaeon]|nr:hypothetical protein [archaeon]
MGGLNEEEKREIISALKSEPLSIQEVSKIINKSWVTTNSYLQNLKERTGLIDIKVFRKGSYGALKVVYYKNIGSNSDLIKKNLFNQISRARDKKDFDFMELYQFVPNDQKKVFVENYNDQGETWREDFSRLFKTAEKTIFCFSGNLSFINLQEGNYNILDDIENALKRNVAIKILTRVNAGSMKNLKKVEYLLNKYEDLFEIRHTYQPLRGFIIDQKIARFKNEELTSFYKKRELEENLRIFYEIYDSSWLAWLQDVFWNYYNSAVSYNQREKEIREVFSSIQN